jgi:hypothetical protein
LFEGWRRKEGLRENKKEDELVQSILYVSMELSQ